MFKLPFSKKDKNEEVSQETTVFVENLSDQYLQHSLKTLDEMELKNALRGQFGNLKYTIGGFDASALLYEEKVKLIALLFSLSVKAQGKIRARKELEDLGLKIKDRLGLERDFAEGLKDLPTGIFEFERIKHLSKEGMEEKLRECLIRIDEADVFVEKVSQDKSTDLVARKNMFEAILYNTTDGVFALDLQGNIITFNETMEKLTGYEFKNIEGKPADEIIRLFEASVPLETKVYCPALDTFEDQNVYSNEKLTLVGRDGKKKSVSMVSAVISEGKEVNIGCIVTLADVTKEMELESMKLDFVSMAAHELRTPITSIRGYLDLIDEEAAKKMEEKYREYLSKVVINADRLHILVENLLSISKIERGAMMLNPKQESWVPIVKEITKQFEETADTHGVSISFTEGKSTLPDVVVDKTMIEEVVSNLLDNAVRYTDAGGRVTVSLEELDGEVVTHIKDTGIGIAAAALPHIFKKFYRVSTVLKEGRKGTGLGLFISQQIIQMHHGKIWVDSEEGKGSTFSFSVPIYKKEKEKTK